MAESLPPNKGTLKDVSEPPNSARGINDEAGLIKSENIAFTEPNTARGLAEEGKQKTDDKD